MNVSNIIAGAVVGVVLSAGYLVTSHIDDKKLENEVNALYWSGAINARPEYSNNPFRRMYGVAYTTTTEHDVKDTKDLNKLTKLYKMLKRKSAKSNKPMPEYNGLHGNYDI